MSRYIVDRPFSQHVNGATIPWRAGQIVDREDLIADLLAGRYPISEIVNEDELLTCPHCGMVSSRTAQEGARALLRRAQQLMPGHK